MTTPRNQNLHRTDNKYTPDWREQTIRPIIQNIVKGECISLIGVGTVGKTHFINFMRQPVQTLHHLKALRAYDNLRTEDILYVMIDPNALLYPNEDDIPPVTRCWAGFELIAAAIFDSLNQPEIRQRLQNQAHPEEMERGKDVFGSIYSIYKEGIASVNPDYQVMAFRFLQDIIRRLFQKTHYRRIVLVFDEFEELYESMPTRFFTNLRALRDLFRYQLIYMTVTRIEVHRIPLQNQKTLSQAIEMRLRRLESFLEIFKVPVYLGPANHMDFRQLLLVLNNRLRDGRPLSPDMKMMLEHVSGGHAGLVRTILRHLDDFLNRSAQEQQLTLQTYMQMLPDIRQECDILLRSCSITEREVIQKLAAAGGYSNLDDDYRRAHYSDIQRLFFKGLLAQTNQDWQIVPPLLRTCVQAQTNRPVEARDKDQKSANPPANPPPRPVDMPR